MAGLTLSASEISAMRAVMDACQDEKPTAGLPARATDALRHLIRCDEFDVCGLDWMVLGHYMQQVVTDGSEEMVASVPERFDGEGPECDFWPYWWGLPCSYAERTGDYTSVLKASDAITVPQMMADPRYRDNMVRRGFHREMGVSWPDGIGRSVRALFWRGPGLDFSERDRFILMLLRPHLAAAYWTAPQRDGVKLTPRQREVLRLVGRGLSNREIAQKLQLSEGTVRTHLNNIYGRLEVTSRSAAVARVYGTHGVQAEPPPPSQRSPEPVLHRDQRRILA